MKVTLVQPYYFNIWEAIACGYIFSYCEKHYKGKLDFNFFQGNFDTDETIISGCVDSDIVGFSCTTPTYGHAISLAEKIKKENKKVKIVFGGHHVSALKTLITDNVIDQMVVGEGEEGFLQILNGNTDRIVNGNVINFGDKDITPWVDRTLIKNERTIDLCEKMIGIRITGFQASRGCPYSCTFCAERNITGKIHGTKNPMRSRNVDDVLDEIESVAQQYNLNKFKFIDATFDWTSKYVIEFCKRKIERGITIEWECMIHAASAREQMFPWLKKSNCGQINVGCESGSDKILKCMRKQTNTAKIEKVFDWGKDNDIERRGFFLMGAPEETEDDLKMTEEFVERIMPDYFGITILCPYPGGDYYDHQKYKNVDWSAAGEYSNDIWHTKYFTNQELKDKQQYLTEKFKNMLVWHHKKLAEGKQ